MLRRYFSRSTAQLLLASVGQRFYEQRYHFIESQLARALNCSAFNDRCNILWVLKAGRQLLVSAKVLLASEIPSEKEERADRS